MNRLLLVLGALLALSPCLTGCDDPRPAAASPTRAPDATYTTRGIIDTMPTPGTTITRPQIKHVPIPEFKNAQGETVGMPAMVMEFPPAPDVSLDGFAVGDKVELTFAVWWEGRRGSWLMTHITKLPPDTELNFPKADDAPAEQPTPQTQPAGDHDHH